MVRKTWQLQLRKTIFFKKRLFHEQCGPEDDQGIEN